MKSVLKKRTGQKLVAVVKIVVSRLNMETDSSEEETYFLGTVNTPTTQNHPWVTNLNLNETSVSFKIDSGADVTVIPYKVHLKNQEELTTANLLVNNITNPHKS